MSYIIFLNIFLTFCCLLPFGQKCSAQSLTVNFHEIQVFTGPTKNGTHILKMDINGLTLRKTDLSGNSNHTSKLVNFRELEGSDLKDYRKNFSDLLEFLNEFNYKSFEPLNKESEIQIIEDDTLTKERLISSHDLGTRILIIDNNFESYFIRYYLCEEQLDTLIKKINKVIPKKLRPDYEFRKRCD
ncbi:MAG: hypothetical protein WD077_01070 [Bacteroidia bacterium]